MSINVYNPTDCKFYANKRAKAEVTKVILDEKSQFNYMCLPTYYVKNTSTNDLYGFGFNPCEFLEDFGIEVEFKEVIRNVDSEPKFSFVPPFMADKTVWRGML